MGRDDFHIIIDRFAGGSALKAGLPRFVRVSHQPRVVAPWRATMVKLLKSFTDDPRVKQLGPGLITGAADDDPSGIATYSQAGAQFGYSMLWTVLFTYPLMVGIQMVSARLGFITGKGLAANVKPIFPRSILYAIVRPLLLPNTITIPAAIPPTSQTLPPPPPP